jgi:hypothetical protein
MTMSNVIAAVIIGAGIALHGFFVARMPPPLLPPGLKQEDIAPPEAPGGKRARREPKPCTEEFGAGTTGAGLGVPETSYVTEFVTRYTSDAAAPKREPTDCNTGGIVTVEAVSSAGV